MPDVWAGALSSSVAEAGDKILYHYCRSDKEVLEPTPIGPPQHLRVVRNLHDISLLQAGLYRGSANTSSPSDISNDFGASRGHRDLQDILSQALVAANPPDQVATSCRESCKDDATTMQVSRSTSSVVSRIEDEEPGYYLGGGMIGDEIRTADSKSGSSLSGEESITAGSKKTIDTHWNARYQELREYFQKHGHSNVPSVYKQNLALGFWAKRTRHNYKLYFQGQPSNLTPHRIKLLRQVEFQWGRQEISWQSHYRRLQAYKRKHGHLRVSHATDGSLFNWLKRQRKLVHQYQRGTVKNSLTPRRYHQLETLGVISITE